MKRYFLALLIFPLMATAQQQWKNVDSIFGPLPASVHVYVTEAPLDSAPFRAYYLSAGLQDKKLLFDTDTASNRRLTPAAFYQKNGHPLVVVNGTFFSFATNQNLNMVVKRGRVVAYNAPVRGRGADSAYFFPSYRSAIGISKKRKADVAWIMTDSTRNAAYASQKPVSIRLSHQKIETSHAAVFRKWKVQAAIGGGPVLVQNGKVHVTNEEEKLFAGKAINDKHPRTAMGYTADGRLIIMAVEGRNPTASGATLTQLAQLMQAVGCVEALNLDGGGSSCLLVKGKETIRPSDKEGQRPVPGVFLIRER